VLEDRLFQGYWWLPADPETKVPGTLSFSQKRVELELLGSFGAPATPLARIDDQPRILGVTKDHKAVTLEHCAGMGARFGFGGFPTTRFRPRLVLHGLWYEPDERVLFDEISIRYSDLDTWAATSGFSSQWAWDPDGKSIRKLDITYTPPESIEVNLDADTTLGIDFSWTWNGLRRPTTESHIVQTASFRVRCASPATPEQALDYVYHMRNFLSVGVGRPIRVLSVRGFQNPPPDAEVDQFTKLEPRKLEVEILYQTVGSPEPAGKELDISEMLFTLADARPRLGEILQTWFERQELMREVFARYFYLVHGPTPDRDHAFESYVRVLETHHRRTAAETAASDEIRERVQGIVHAVTDVDDREWLEQLLAHSHEPSLSKRLKQTLNRCPTVATRAIGSSKKKDSFVWKVVNTRNYKIHLDPLKKHEAADGTELVVLVYQLRALVEMTLLLELGFECDEVDAIFKRTGQYELIDSITAQL
jgi:ApeA N-terminal domain 1